MMCGMLTIQGTGEIMKVGDLVRVYTKHYGEKLGVVVEVDKEGVRIKPQAHPRDIVALPQDVKVLVSV
jgi:hypothetical protein